MESDKSLWCIAFNRTNRSEPDEMSFLNLFSKKGRELINARFEYDQCRKRRNETLQSLRRKAMEHFSSKYARCSILVNNADVKFMVLAPSAGRLFVGKFVDHYYPSLDYVDDRSEDAGSFNRATSLFTAQTRFITASHIPLQESARLRKQFINPDFLSAFDTNGYAVSGAVPLKYLVGGALFLDDVQIAKSSLWSPAARGHFAEKLVREVIEGGAKNPDTRHLRFVALDNNPIGEGQKTAFDFFYSKSLIAFDPNAKREFVEVMSRLIEFTQAIEPYFKAGAPGADADKIDYTDPSCDETLDSPEFVEDISIDTYYGV